MESTPDVEQAVSALTVELLKLAPRSGAEERSLSVTIENALSRLAEAVAAQAKAEPLERLGGIAPGG